MKPSFSWSNPITGSIFRPCKLRHLVTFILCLVLSFMTACVPPLQIPPYFETLERAPIERIPINTVLVHGQRIAYLDVGTGPPVILIHGFGGSMWQWEHQQHALSQHFRTLTLDLPGSGLSDKPDIEYLPDQMLDFCIGFMERPADSSRHARRQFYGPALAIGMTLTHPTRVDKLVLISGLPSQVMAKLTSRWLFQASPRISSPFLGRLLRQLAVRRAGHRFRPERNRPRPHPPHTGRHRTVQPEPPTPRHHQAHHGRQECPPFLGKRFRPRLSSITHPTMIIWGEHDRCSPWLWVKNSHNRIRVSQMFDVIPKAGHMPQWEQPDLVNRSVIAYIQPSP